MSDEDSQHHQDNQHHQDTFEVMEVAGNLNTIPAFYNKTSIDDLMNEGVSTMKSMVIGRLLRVVSIKDGASKGLFSYNRKTKERNTVGTYRLLLFMDPMSKNNACFYIKAVNTMNRTLFSKFITVRDSGHCTVGSLFAVLGPKGITERYCNDIAILEPKGSLVLLKEPEKMKTVPIQHSLDGKRTASFSITGRLFLHNFSVVQTKCNGLFCDRQGVCKEKKDNGCGCYSDGNTMHANLTICFDLGIETENATESFEYCDYTSHKFTQFFLNTPFPSSTRWQSFDHDEQNYPKLMTCIENILEYVNNNGKWTIIGWTKRGEINDITFRDTDSKVSSSELKHHVTCILPKKEGSTISEETFKQKQFDVNNIL